MKEITDSQLKELTLFQLNDLAFRIGQEIKSCPDRGKKQCYKVFIACDGTKSFIKKENAIDSLIRDLEYLKDYQDDEFPVMVSIKIAMMDEAEIRNCEDYEEVVIKLNKPM